MRKTNPLITGTVILTLTGLLSRIIGFFYRIYLSRLFGEEGMGVYQLLGPVTALTFSLTAAGLQTAISKYVAGETSTRDYKSSFRILATGLSMSLFLSAICTYIIYHFSELIGTRFLLEPRTSSMLRIIALSVPLGAVHSCINGYFYGIKKTGVPAATQLIEQLCRVGCVWLANYAAVSKGVVVTINVAVIGLVIGEGCAMLVSITAIYLRFYRLSNAKSTWMQAATVMKNKISTRLTAAKLLGLAVPLSANRIVINFLQSIEAIYIPNKLQAFGYDTATALSVYGVLTGMALPLIFFPNALTGSMSVLLLPVVSEADATGNHKAVRKAISRTVQSCTLLGAVCMILFLLAGRAAGSFLFHSELAGHYIVTLSFICPFMYLNTTLSSILHGLDRAGAVFCINVISLFIRLGFVFLIIPVIGMNGYIWGLLVSQAFTTGIFLFLLYHRK